MSKPTRVPFFARFIETEAPAIDTNVRAGADGGGTTWPPYTMKYPSDAVSYTHLTLPTSDLV